MLSVEEGRSIREAANEAEVDLNPEEYENLYCFREESFEDDDEWFYKQCKPHTPPQ